MIADGIGIGLVGIVLILAAIALLIFIVRR